MAGIDNYLPGDFVGEPVQAFAERLAKAKAKAKARGTSSFAESLVPLCRSYASTDFAATPPPILPPGVVGVSARPEIPAPQCPRTDHYGNVGADRNSTILIFINTSMAYSRY